MKGRAITIRSSARRRQMTGDARRHVYMGEEDIGRKKDAAASGRPLTLKEARRDGAFWGRVVESAVGAHLANAAAAGVCEVYYWRDRDREVDFVARAGQTLTAIGVKSGRARDVPPGLAAFAEAHRPKRKLLVGGDGIPLEEFLSRPVQYWVRK